MSPPDNAEDGNKPESTPEEETTPPSQPQPTIAKTEVSQNTQNRPARDQAPTRELRREFRWFEIGSLIVNGVLAVIGVVALTIYGGQLEVMRGTLTQMLTQTKTMQEQLEQMKGSSAQTDKLIKSSQTANDITKHGLEAFFRVVVGFNPINTDQRDILRNQAGWINISGNNVGKSRATNVTLHYHVHIRDIENGASFGRDADDSFPTYAVEVGGSIGTRPGQIDVKNITGTNDLAILRQQLSRRIIIVRSDVTYDAGFGASLSQSFCNVVINGSFDVYECDRSRLAIDQRRSELGLEKSTIDLTK